MELHELKKKEAKWIGYLGIIINPHFIPLQNEPSHILVGPTLGAPCVLSAENVTFQESCCNIEKWMNRKRLHIEPIEGIKVWLLVGYLSNILGYRSKYWNYTSKTKLGRVPHSPQAPPTVDNVFTLHLTKNIIEHKWCIIWF